MATIPAFDMPLRRRYKPRHSFAYDKALEVILTDPGYVPSHRAEVDVKVGAR